MPFYIVRNDIAKMQVDAVVNAANAKLLAANDGVCGALFREAGAEQLQRACQELGSCETGDAVVTPGFNLTARYIIHAVGPVWRGGQAGEAACLLSCYERIFALAQQRGVESIAIPLISTGAFGYPRAAALAVALEAIGTFLFNNDMVVYLVVYDRSSVQISKTLFASIQEYIGDTYVEAYQYAGTRTYEDSSVSIGFELPKTCTLAGSDGTLVTGALGDSASYSADGGAYAEAPVKHEVQRNRVRGHGDRGLEDVLGGLDESFSQSLLRLIDERGFVDAEVYKRANISRKLFSKIRSDLHYRPSKPTVLAFAVALELSLPETESLLKKAGFALSHSNKFDVIVEYFIVHESYNIFAINEALFSFDQILLGS